VPFDQLNRRFIDLKKVVFSAVRKQKIYLKYHSTTWIILPTSPMSHFGLVKRGKMSSQ